MINSDDKMGQKSNKRPQNEQKIAKKRGKEASKLVGRQDKGKFKLHEIAVVLSRSTHESCAIVGEKFFTRFIKAEELDNMKFIERNEEMRGPIEGLLVQWTHRRHLDGGAADIGQPNVKFVECVFITIPALSFVELAMKDDYEMELTSYFKKIKDHVLRGPPSAPSEGGETEIEESTVRFIFGICEKEANVGKWVLALASATPGYSKQVTQQVDEAAMYCTYELGIEIVERQNPDQLSEYLVILTRQLASAMYIREESTLVMKRHERAAFEPTEPFLGGLSEHYRKFTWDQRQLWMAMLRTFPGISQEKARALVLDAPVDSPYSSPCRLLTAVEAAAAAAAAAAGDGKYGDKGPTDNSTAVVADIQALEEDMSGRFGKANKERKLARRILKLFTTIEPSDSIRLE